MTTQRLTQQRHPVAFHAAVMKMVPYRDGADVNEGMANWKFNAADLCAIENETAPKLLPNLKTV